MNEFEKVEKLVQKANVSYEDAKKALEESNGDMLDAMILLEKQGKVKKPESVEFSTTRAEQERYTDVPAAVQKAEQYEDRSFMADLGSAFKKFLKYTSENYLLVTHRGERVFDIPLWLAIIVVFCIWPVLLLVVVISLFCECRYKVHGKNESKEVNVIFDQASNLANKAKGEFAESQNTVDATVETGTTDTTVE